MEVLTQLGQGADRLVSARAAAVDYAPAPAYNSWPMIVANIPGRLPGPVPRTRSARVHISGLGHLALTVFLAFAGGCLAPGPAQDDAAIATVRCQLIVLPVRADATGSGFPTHPRNVVSAAHVLGGAGVASVDGRRMFPFLRTAFATDRRRARSEDWVILSCAADRWHYNDLEPDHEFQTGDAVFISGFPAGADDDEAAVRHAPAVIMGRIIAPYPGDGPRVRRAVIPPTDTAGMSGGPVAVLDAEDRVHVVGIYSARSLDVGGLRRRQVAIFLTPAPGDWQPARFARRARADEAPPSAPGPRPDYRGSYPPTIGDRPKRDDLRLPAYLQRAHRE